MDQLSKLESKSIFIIREAFANFKNLAMLWSIGKDSTVLLWLTRKAFLGKIPFPLIHIDTGFKIPAMIQYRNQLAQTWKLNLLVSQNKEAIESKKTFPDGKVDRLTCCQSLKSKPLKELTAENGKRLRFDHKLGKLVPDTSNTVFTGIIAGIRADEEGSRSKERFFSSRDCNNEWDLVEQPPEFWNQYKTDFKPGTHVRIHPLLEWQELDIWEYIDRESIPIIDLYFDRGSGTRYRSLGCYPCTKPILSTAKSASDIVQELRQGPLAKVAERAGRSQDLEDRGTLETLRRDGYM